MWGVPTSPERADLADAKQEPETPVSSAPPSWVDTDLRLTDMHWPVDPGLTSSAMLQAVFENLGVALAIDEAGRFIYANQAFLDLLGYEASEIQGRAVVDLTHPEDVEVERTLLEEIDEGRSTHYQLEKRYLRKNGQTVWVDLYRTSFRSTLGDTKLGLRIVRDITERRQAEERSRELSAIVDQVADAVIGTDLSFRVTTWNQAAEAMYGWSQHEALGQLMPTLVPTEYEQGETRETAASRLMASGRWEGEVTQRHRDGHSLMVHASVSLIKDSEGNPVGIAGINRDISERKRTRQALLESEQLARTLLNATHDFAHLIDEKGTIIDLNRAMAEALGCTREDALGKCVYDLCQSESSKEPRKQVLNQALNEQRAIHFVDEGTPGLTLDSSVYPVPSGEGEGRRAVVFARDVSVQKLAEENLRNSEANYRSLAEGIQEGILVASEDAKHYSNPRLLEILDLPSEEFGAEEVLARVHPHDREEVLGHWNLVVSGSAPSQLEFRVVRTNGETRWARAKLSAVQWAGTPAFMALVDDITERRLVAERLRAGEEQYRKRLEAEIAARVDQLRWTNLALAQEVRNRMKVEGKLARRVADLDALNEIGRALGRAEDFTENLATCCHIIRRHLDAHCVRIVLLGDEDFEPLLVTLQGEAGSPQIMFGGPNPDFLQIAEIQAVIESRRPSQLGEYAGLRERLALHCEERAGGQAFVVPLVDREKTIGLLIVGVGDEDSSRLLGRSSQVLNTASKDIARAIDNERLRMKTGAEIAAAERNRLASDLHDAVTQSIYSACLIAEALPALATSRPGEVPLNLERLRRLVRGALGEMRALLFELRPNALIAAELPILIAQLSDALGGRVQIPIETSIRSGEEPLPAVKIALYRIAQEACNNIAKHAAARTVRIGLDMNEAVIELVIEDDGRGFRVEDERAEALGLSIMQERARGIGASCLVTSEPGKGAQVRVVWRREEHVDKRDRPRREAST